MKANDSRSLSRSDPDPAPTPPESLHEPVPAGTNPVLSDLVMVADSTKKLVSGKDVDFAFEGIERDKLKVILKVDAAMPPDAGTYHGVVQVDTKIVATVIFVLT